MEGVIAMTKLERQTAQNRIQSLFDLNAIIALAEGQLSRVQGIPMLDDEDHADWMQGYTDRVHEICMEMQELRTFGHRGGVE